MAAFFSSLLEFFLLCRLGRLLDAVHQADEREGGAASSSCSRSRSSKKGLDAKALLAKHDSYGFFSALGDLLVTGPTRTNVNDYRAIVVA